MPTLLLLLAGCFGPTCAEADLFYEYEFIADNTFAGCVYTSTVTVGANRCRGKPHETRYWPDGSLRSCYLDGDQTFAGLPLLDETGIWVRQDGKLSSFSLIRREHPFPTVEVAGHDCTSAKFFPDGKLASCTTFTEGQRQPNLECYDANGTKIGFRECRELDLDGDLEAWKQLTRRRR